MHARAFLVAVVLLAVVGTGCATAYGTKGVTGGYEEEWLGETRFRVVFHHNGYTSEAKADALVLRRAAELALENGFRYVAIEGLRDRHPVLVGSLRHVAEVELLDEPREGARDATEIIRETESFAGGRLSDAARQRLMEIARERPVGG